MKKQVSILRNIVGVVHRGCSGFEEMRCGRVRMYVVLYGG